MTAPRIGIVGAGAFGTALAVSLAREGRWVTLWSRDGNAAAAMRRKRENAPHLPGVELPENVSITAEIADLADQKTVLLALPMQALQGFLSTVGRPLDGQVLVACCKGVDLTTMTGPSGILAALAPRSKHAILTGPSFAADIAKGLPTALTLACREEGVGPTLQQLLSTSTLRLYLTDDLIGAELGGALKNVIAIAAGIAIGAGLGESARAALMTRGYAEITRLACGLGARAETLAGLSGFGDLVLTCTSTQSRNFRYGHALGSRKGFDPAITVEGAATARAVSRLAEQRNIDLPITRNVAALIDGRLDLPTAIQALLSRPLKKE
jgi:glycerol-3-phosphate dehydrogenase (NAD(P)+)